MCATSPNQSCERGSHLSNFIIELTVMSNTLSDYELARLENIKKNEEFLKSLGLYKDPLEVAKKEAGEELRRKAEKIKKRAARDDDGEEYVPVRRSSRKPADAANKEEGLVSLSDVEGGGTARVKRKYNPQEDAEQFFKIKTQYADEDDDAMSIRITPEQLRTYVQGANVKHSEMISDKAISLCAYRCSYMSVAALRNRINAINRGAGAKSKEKLLVVTYAMRAMGLIKLSEIAAQYLKYKTGIQVSWCDDAGGGVPSSSADTIKLEQNVAQSDHTDIKLEHNNSAAIPVKIKEEVGSENVPVDVNSNADSDVHVKEESMEGVVKTSSARRSSRSTSKTPIKEESYW